MRFIKSLTVLFVVYFFSNVQSGDKAENHVIFYLQNKIQKNKKNDYNQRIHDATYELKQACKKRYNNTLENNTAYPHRRDTVFFIHFDHNFNTWTLYKPSFIRYEDFTKLAQKIYAKYKLYVLCQPDKSVVISNSEVDSINTKYLTLNEFEEYKNINDDDLEKKIECAQQTSCKSEEEKFSLEAMQDIARIKKLFFWHLQIPTTGALADHRFDIDQQFKPLAWHFLLWDLAPKKGRGAKVAIIDTGASAFNIQEKEFAQHYKKNINITVPDQLHQYGYNLVSENGLDPIRQIAINFGHYCDHTKFNSNDLMQKLPEWIIELIKNKNDLQIRQYFAENAKKDYLNKDASGLNEKGEEVLKDLLYGKYGVVPSEKNSFFHIVNLQDPYNTQVLLETLPAPQVAGSTDSFSAGHGTFTQGVVNGKLYEQQGITGLAPEADVTMIKAFHDNGTTNKTTLNAALQRALTLKSSIVSMSLKITDEIDKVKDAPLKELIDSIDYVVAASGNDGNTKELAYKEAYPAKFDSVAFDVGAFSYDQGDYSVCTFTQKEEAVGPKFVAPGFNIFSAGLTPGQVEDSMYVFMTGTSIAVPVITGFMALVLGEFERIFTREQILKVIYKFSMKLSNDEIWQKYIKLGTPDMRSSLLCLHVLQALRSTLEAKPELAYNFDKNFDNLVQAIYTINYYVPSSYEEKLHHSFTQSFAQYLQATKNSDQSLPSIDFFTPKSNDIDECIKFIKDLIVKSLQDSNQKKKNNTKKNIQEQLIKSLQSILFNKKIKLFENASNAAQSRLNLALMQRGVCPV